MPEPTFGETTERFYDRLPGLYRREDTQNDWTLKSWTAGITEVLGEIDTLIDRINYTPIEDGPEVADLHSDLVDPYQADAVWLSWLAQLVGVKFDYVLTEIEKRDRIANAIGGVQAGTKAAIAQAAQTVLTGTKTVYVHSFSNLSGVGAGTQWETLILTLAAETSSDPIAAVIKAGAKPAGVKLYHTTYGASWTTVEATYPTWADWDSTTWESMERT